MSTRFPALVMTAALAACASEPPPPPPAAPPPAAPAEKKPAADVAAEAPTYEYAYSPVGKRDPFRSVLDDLAELPPNAGANRPDCGPLCKWELEQLKLVAVISGISNPLGMVEDPGGKGYVVRRGSFIGKRNGKVTQIRAGEVIVTEIFKDQLGKPHTNEVSIKMPVEQQQQNDDVNLLGPEVAE